MDSTKILRLSPDSAAHDEAASGRSAEPLVKHNFSFGDAICSRSGAVDGKFLDPVLQEMGWNEHYDSRMPLAVRSQYFL